MPEVSVPHTVVLVGAHTLAPAGRYDFVISSVN
jgi:hypothetical protein